MDSRLLNVVYDDPFDGNYGKYNNDTEFWSGGSETMGMQLAETLNGILPIAPTEDFHKEDNPNQLNIQNCKTTFKYEDLASQHLATGEEIEIVTVDPNNDGYDTDSEDEEDSNDENDLLDFERQSQCSNATFRTRTDSSSIGDYESHTSDYDDDNDDNKDKKDNSVDNTRDLLNVSSKMFNNANNSLIESHSNLVVPDDLLLYSPYHKSRTLSTNTLNSEVDGLGLHIDANNFDLAEFITKDDFQLHNQFIQSNAGPKTKAVAQKTKSLNLSTVQPSSVVEVITSKNNDSDSDSDIIVDVETVEKDDDDDVSFLKTTSDFLKQQIDDDVPFIDNVTTDPSWSPTLTTKKVENHKVEEKSFTHKSNFKRNISLVPNKKQCDLLKGKFAKVKGKSMQKHAKPTDAKTSKIGNNSIKETYTATTNSEVKSEIGNIGENLALIQNENVSITKQKSIDDNPSAKRDIIHCIPKKQKPITSNTKLVEKTPAQNAEAVKRKLNLEEYKKRRIGEFLTVNCTPQSHAKFVSHKIPKLESKTKNFQINNDKKPVVNNTTTKRSEVVTSIVKTLKEQRNLDGKSVIDPITEAKNKVLRMKELKKAQQMRIIDSTITAKVPRVSKLLPLKEIVKYTSNIDNEECKLSNSQFSKSDYEEIIIVSASCNTCISIPPIPNPNLQSSNNATRSLLKSSALLSSITNTVQKVNATDNTKLSTSSLIASIQDVVVKKTLPAEKAFTIEDIKDTKKPEHHGEDKIIMHLRKDRIRKRMISIATQTDLQPGFAPLPLPKSNMFHKSRERTRRHRKRQYRKRRDTSTSSLSDSSTNDSSDSSKSSTIMRSRDNSCSSSLERVRIYDSAIGTGGYSSRSSLRHRSSVSSSYSESGDHKSRGRRQRRTSYTKRSTARKRSRSSYSTSSDTSNSDCSHSSFYRRSRSRSNSLTHTRSRRSSYHKVPNKSNTFLDRNISQPAVEERRIVYVGRIEQETTKDMLRRKFLKYGTIKQISMHFKDTGMKYGFVTFERSQDAFAAIDNSSRDPQINMYDISFGGRRAFCRASYADLDNAGINTYQSYVFPQPITQPKQEDSFEALLMKMKAKLNANKTTITAPRSGSESADTNGQNNKF